MTVENLGNGPTWRMPDEFNRIQSDMPDFGDFRRSRRSAYKVLKCVAGFILLILFRTRALFFAAFPSIPLTWSPLMGSSSNIDNNCSQIDLIVAEIEERLVFSTKCGP